jgi:hypothetical protein
MSKANWVIPEDETGISDSLFAQVCHSTPQEARELSLKLPLAKRVQLALYCNARSHLRHIGLAIARVCDESSLARAAGSAGSVLFRQADAEPALSKRSRGSARISLARV